MKRFVCTASFILSLTIISQAQNVGIGTATPAYKLDVLGRMRVKTGTLNNINTTSGIFFEDYRDGTNRVFAGMQDSIRWGLYGDGVGGVGWKFNFNAKTGGVGIGRSATGGGMEIDDPAGGVLDMFSNGLYAGSLRSTDTSLQLTAATSSAICFPAPCTPPPPKDIILQAPPTSFLFQSGRVGIGTNGPKTKLHINGNVLVGSSAVEPAAGYLVSIDGKVIAEELRVQLQTAWPDYVFKKDYKLRSINQLEAFIKQNHHLPGIKSAVEMENGQDVGETQRRMMEKIEELTLYIIELKKENERLNKKVDAIGKKVAAKK